MRVEFHGAARTVTGSCTLLEAGGTRVLVDCGQFQGDAGLEARNHEPFRFDVASIDAFVLTHAHVDHAGRAPALVRQGLRGPVVSTRATAALAAVMLQDAAKIAEEDSKRGGGPPLFGAEDVEALFRRSWPLKYGETLKIGPGIQVTLFDAGHILGSAHVLVTMTEGGRTLRFGISGDVGARDRPVVDDPHPFRAVDLLQVETTYGDRDHGPQDESVAELLRILETVEREGGIALVPAFALGRTQEILWHLNGWKNRGRLKRLAVYVDSPLATRLTQVFEDSPTFFDDDTKGLLRRGDDPFDFDGLEFVRDWRRSQRLPEEAKSALIVASSGMCQGGRVVDHLRALLPRPSTHVVFVGFQAPGTLGRRLASGEKQVHVRGQPVEVRAQVHVLPGFSAHAGKTELLAWVKAATPPPKRAFLVHGEPDVQETFAKTLRSEAGIADVVIPAMHQSFDL